MKNIFFFFVCWSTRVGALVPPSQPLSLTPDRGGYDERYVMTDPVDQIDIVCRYMDIQQKVRALENPSLSITLRADMAKEWLELDCRIRPSNLTLRLWKAWLLESRDDDATTSPSTLF